MSRTDPLAQLNARGWTIFPHDPAIAAWVEAARPLALAACTAPEHRHWLRCGDTWFAGVNALGNDATGRIGSGPILSGAAVTFLNEAYGALGWDAGQVSAVYPGYPKQDGESDAAFGFRLRRDAAHVDGLLREGPGARRHLREYHQFVLGLPLTDCDAGASPLVVWEGSHRIIGKMFRDALGSRPVSQWGDPDLTEIYAETRRRIFDTCARVSVVAAPGQAYVIHRHALHGISPWRASAKAETEGRVIAYFRPETPDRKSWLFGA